MKSDALTPLIRAVATIAASAVELFGPNSMQPRGKRFSIAMDIGRPTRDSAMDMHQALIAYLKAELASGKLSPEQTAKLVDEIHQVRRRVVKPRDPSRDHEPI